MVGNGDGWAVGRRVGANVGEAVGWLEGRLDGPNDGNAVGCDLTVTVKFWCVRSTFYSSFIGRLEFHDRTKTSVFLTTQKFPFLTCAFSTVHLVDMEAS